MNLENIRNFSIIAHIDHGKSTLADRLLEITGTIEKRKMMEQVLDSMELERERGITIKMQPVRMNWQFKGEDYVLNLIDTPGHIDFSYEVSRSLKAVEGVILLVDATKGVQAQTISVLSMAREADLKIIPVINKIDLPVARTEEVIEEIVELLNCCREDILKISAKTGMGVEDLLKRVINVVPPPQVETSDPKGKRALVFDLEYSTHQGIIVYVRVFDGEINRHDKLTFTAAEERFSVLSVGTFRPTKTESDKLVAGEIGYLVTGIKEQSRARVGDTINNPNFPLPAFPGYTEPRPMVWAAIYPNSQNDFALLKQALQRLSLSDSSLSFSEEAASSLGRGFICGFLGLLHLEIITERLKREFNLELTVTSPSISYQIIYKATGKEETITSPHLFPENLKQETILEPWAEANIITPTAYLEVILKMLNSHEALPMLTTTLSYSRSSLTIQLPLRELMRNFFNELKSISSGYASLSYHLIGLREADVVKLEILITEEVEPALTRIVSRSRLAKDAEDLVERLRELLPRQLFVIKIQARAQGRIIASRSISALKKNVTDYLYGGDITRKMKLREKQKKGKKKMQARASMKIPHDVFVKLLGSKE